MMRDKNDNVVVVCSIENFDPVGVHTGDSITVAPALTLTDREYQRLRDISIAVIREVGVDTGGCNIQFAVEPDTGRVVVIEMNPRVSRSSALASKATGFAIAKIATKLSLGYTLDEIPNDITQKTPASFEPTLDYVVVKVPRFAFEKFPAADPTLTTTMKSVGEAMAMGRNFTEALQKALRSLEQKGSQLDFSPVPEWEVAGADREGQAPHHRAPAPGPARPARRRHRGAALRGHQDRPLVPGPAPAAERDLRAKSARPRALTAGDAAARQAPRLLRRADRRPDPQLRGRGPRRPPGPGHPSRSTRPWTPAPPSSPPTPRTTTPPTTRRTRLRCTPSRPSSSSAPAPTGSARASSSTTPACTPRWRCARPATRP